MYRFYILILLLAAFCGRASAQTVIDLRRGGAVVRGKQKSDYDVQHRTPQQQRQDSLEYVDCLTRAFNYLHADSLTEARQCLTRALRLRPEAPGNFVLHDQLGRISMAEGRYAAAVEHFDRVLQQRPSQLDTRMARATCHIELSHPQQALDDCRSLFQQAPDTATAVRILFLQCAAHKQLRQFPQVADDLARILSLQPGNESAILLQAVNLEELGQPQEAINRLNLYVSAHPHDISGLVARAEMLLRQHYPILAMEDINQAIQLQPHDAALYLLRAKIFDEMGEKRRAEEDRRRAKRP